ncbi:hypothetical protein [Saccharopolyspora aridisoli]|nr:hypothetical protein [Saccharopolyspora aridisoli]
MLALNPDAVVDRIEDPTPDLDFDALRVIRQVICDIGLPPDLRHSA